MIVKQFGRSQLAGRTKCLELIGALLLSRSVDRLMIACCVLSNRPQDAGPDSSLWKLRNCRTIEVHRCPKIAI